MQNSGQNSRRPIAAVFRRTSSSAVAFCVRWNVHPDLISYSSIVAACIAATCFWQAGRQHLLLLIAPLFCYLRLWLNMLDGMVAIAAERTSAWGEIVNDLPDRVSDVLIFAGVASSGLCNPASAYWAAIAALITAYVGTLGKAVGAQREFRGMMSKPWRMVTLQLGAGAAYVTLAMSPDHLHFGGLSVLDGTCLIIVAGCIQTIYVRLRQIHRSLG